MNSPNRKRNMTVMPKFEPSNLVNWCMLYGNTASWVPDTIDLQMGPVSYTVRLEDDTIIRHHINQMQRRLSSHQVVPPVLSMPMETFQEYVTESREESEAYQPAQLCSPAKPPTPSQQTDIVPAAASVAEPRHSARIRKQHERLDL